LDKDTVIRKDIQDMLKKIKKVNNEGGFGKRSSFCIRHQIEECQKCGQYQEWVVHADGYECSDFEAVIETLRWLLRTRKTRNK
jgi:hypothetical protein